MYDQPAIPMEPLRACLQEQYGLIPTSLDFLPLGLDADAGVYRLVSEYGAAYLLKVTSRPLYEPRCLVPRYLHEQGITSVVAPLPTGSSVLWARVEEWTVIVYPFIDGDTGWTGMSDEQWQEVGSIFRRIHEITLPPEGLASMLKETFDPTEYARWIHTFETQHLHAREGAHVAQRPLQALWKVYESKIHTVVAIMETLGKILRSRTLPYVICHADLHPANLLRDQHGRVFVIDWDEVMLAPKERDFIFVRTSSADSEALPGAPAFIQGYGQTDIDWIALTYYRYERVIQDVVAYARDAFFRDDWSEESRTEALRRFGVNLSESGEIDGAFVAAAHLPSDLGIPRLE